MKANLGASPSGFFQSIFMLILLTGCGKPTEVGLETRPKSDSQAAVTETELEERPGTEKWIGDLDGIRQRRVLRALVCYNRVFYFFDKGKPRGFAVESLREFETFLNKKLNPRDRNGTQKIQVALIPVSNREIFQGLVEGRGDVAVANLSISPERLQLVQFSEPTRKNVQQIVVGGPATPPLSSLEDLAGMEVWAKASSTHHRNLQTLNDLLVQKGKPPIQIRETDENLEDDDVLEMVAAGNYAATVMDDHVARFWAQVLPDLKPFPGLILSNGGEKAWAFRKNSPQLESLVNEFLENHGLGSSFENTLIRRYMEDVRYAKNAWSPQALRQFENLSALFQKYGEQYDFPWLLLTAQAYQESQFDQKARSASGAIGIMQVLPGTAAAPPISIKNITVLENNIHAGVRLLKFIRDDYLKDEPMDEFNKTLITLASYNAGPARLSQCRQTAEKMALNPNQWFGNLEYAVAKRVGRQTVDYVSNIHKYFLTFQLALARERGRKDALKTVGKSAAKAR